jgi:hypothetical protein
MYFSKKNYPPVSEDIKKYIKENNTKIFNNHQLQASKMKINHIFENEKEDNNNDYFFYDLNDINDENKKKIIEIKNNENKSKLIEIKNNNKNIEKYNNSINNHKVKILYVLSTSSIFMIITYIMSYKYYLHIRRI